MKAALRLGLALAIGSARGQRLRALSVLLGAVLGSVAMLAVTAVARAQGGVHGNGVATGTELLRYRLALLLVVGGSVMVLLLAIGRLSARLREVRLANLRLLGMSRAQVRMVAAVEVGVVALAGSGFGGLVFLAVRPVLSPLAGHDPTARALLWPGRWWLPLLIAVPLVVVLAAAGTSRLDSGTALASAHQGSPRRPGWWRVVVLAAGGIWAVSLIANLWTGIVGRGVALFGSVGLLGISVVAITPFVVRLLAGLLVARRHRPALLVAGRRLQHQPAGVARVVSGLMLGVFLAVGGRCVLVALEQMGQVNSAAWQLKHGQFVEVDAPARTADLTQREIDAVAGASSSAALPRLQAICPRRATRCSSGEVLVATCPQLHFVDPRLGCEPGRVLSLGPVAGSGGPIELRPYTEDRAKEPTVSGVTISTSGAVPERPGRLSPLEIRGESFVVPPSRALTRLMALSDRTWIVRSGPGRDLVDRVQIRHGYMSSSADFPAYDNVQLLLTTMWSIAGLVVGVGLLSFALGAIDRAVNRRYEMGSLRALGVSPRMALKVQYVEAWVPIAAGVLVASLLGALAGETYLAYGRDIGYDASLQMPWHAIGLLSGTALIGTVLVAALTAFASTPVRQRRT